MKYPFVPFPERKPLRWPNGKRLAVMITTNLEYWDATKDTPKPFYPGGPGIVGGDLPGTSMTIRIRPGANTGSASASGGCSTSSTSSACRQPAR